MKASYDDEDNVPPYLPDTSVGSSVSSTMENEYNEFLLNTMVVPLYEPEQIKVQKVLQNSLGLFATMPVSDRVHESNKAEVNERDLNESDPESQNVVICPAIVINEHEEVSPVCDIIITNEFPVNNAESVGEREVNEIQKNTENDSKGESSLEEVEKKELVDEETVEKLADTDRCVSSEINKSASENQLEPSKKPNEMEDEKTDDLIITMPITPLTTDSSDSSSQEKSEPGTELGNNDRNDSRANNEDMPNAVSEEIYSIMMKNLEVSHLESDFYDSNPRKNSPVPASPPSNLELDVNERSSLDQMSMMSQSVKVLNESRPEKMNKTDENVNKKLFKSMDMNNNLSSRKNGSKNKQDSDKPVKIGANIDKWLKDLKGHILSEFEKSRVQLMQDQQKKLYTEKEKQAVVICKLKRELEMTQEKLKIAEVTNIKKNEAIENLSIQLEKQREKTDLQRVMMEWKFKKLETEREDFTTKLAQKFYSQRLKMRSFLSWHCYMASRHRTKLEKACKKKAEEVCYDLATKYEGRIKKIEGDLQRSKGEIEMYKEEMTKNEDYMKKALMRGVCALNMEAMSIFNETIGKTNSQTSSTSSMENISEPVLIQQQHKHVIDENVKSHVAYYPNNHRDEAQTVNRNETSLEAVDSKELAKIVKNYCNQNLDCKNMSALSKAKRNLLNSNPIPQNRYEPEHGNSHANLSSSAQANQAIPQTQAQQQPHRAKELENSNTRTQTSNSTVHCRLNTQTDGRVFDELSEHNIQLNVKSTPSLKQKAKSKINSLPSTPHQVSKKDPITVVASPHTSASKITSMTRPVANLPPHAPAYRSVVIEKHSKYTDDNVKSSTTKVKYNPPGQPATVLNTVINTFHENMHRA